eukprot:3938429-Rhodomonas_salina.1
MRKTRSVCSAKSDTITELDSTRCIGKSGIRTPVLVGDTRDSTDAGGRVVVPGALHGGGGVSAVGAVLFCDT